MSHTYETVYERTLGSVGNILPDNAVRGVTLTGKFTDTVDRDALRRPSVRKLTLSSASSPLMTDTYGYLSRTGGGTTNYVSTLSHKVGSSTSSLSYTYNNNGNITEIRENGTLKYKYTYDSLNRLTREDNYDAGVSYTWTYTALCKRSIQLNLAKMPSYRQLKAILKKGDLPDIRLHDLRHTFTSHAANSGIAPKTLCR